MCWVLRAHCWFRSEPLFFFVFYFGLGGSLNFVVIVYTFYLSLPCLTQLPITGRLGGGDVPESGPFSLAFASHLQVALTLCSQIIFDVGTEQLSLHNSFRLMHQSQI